MFFTKHRIAIIGALVITVGAATAIFFRYFMTGPFMYAGTLEVTKIIVSARVASDISDIMVVEGDAVVAGAPLMRLSCDTYKIMATQINNDFERAQALRERGHMAQAEYDVLSRNKQDNDLKLDWCDVKSPIDGMVITKFREIGEVVSPGVALISVANPYDIWAYFYVPYEMLHRLRLGQLVVGTLPEAPGLTFNGRIIKISEEAEFTPKNVQTARERMRLVYGVKVKFNNPDLILKSGMTIESALINE